MKTATTEERTMARKKYPELSFSCERRKPVRGGVEYLLAQKLPRQPTGRGEALRRWPGQRGIVQIFRVVTGRRVHRIRQILTGDYGVTISPGLSSWRKEVFRLAVGERMWPERRR